MAYTVSEVAELSGVTIKTLYHYHKIGLLYPASISENGYRIYEDKELEKLQQILFYRELDLPLEKIKKAIKSESSRLECLYEQEDLLKARKQRTQGILNTLKESIACIEKGVVMSKERMFKGLNKEEWENNISEQNNHLEKTYGVKLNVSDIETNDMNEKANEAMEFMSFMATSLRNGLSVNDESVFLAVKNHIEFLRQRMEMDAEGFVAQSRFLMEDKFHRQMIEKQQIGLSYYICFAAENYAEAIK